MIDKEFFKTKKGMAIGIVGICCIGIIILAMGGMFSPDNSNNQITDSSNQNSSESVKTGDNSNQNTNTVKGYQVRITTSGSWSGSIGSIDQSTYDGAGDKTIDVKDVSGGILVAVIQKQGGDSSELKVEILKDGKVIKEGSTTAAYGVVTVSS